MLAILLAAVQAVASAAPPPTPSAIVAAAKPADWMTIAPDDLLVMELAPDAKGRARRVVIQLIAAPFSQGWVANIRTLARAHWWDGTAVTRVQDNYVAQWGDPDGETVKAKPLPTGLRRTDQRDYVAILPDQAYRDAQANDYARGRLRAAGVANVGAVKSRQDPYAGATWFWQGWPLGEELFHLTSPGVDKIHARAWPVHCYATVGVGRGLSPDTGTGAELYTVIGHAPRHLDRNIAVVGRVVEGIENLSSLPRGTGALGVYETAGERTAIRSIRLASELPPGERPRLQYLSTESDSFAAYANARANRRDAFFIQPAGGVDVCNVPVPVRRAP